MSTVIKKVCYQIHGLFLENDQLSWSFDHQNTLFNKLKPITRRVNKVTTTMTNIFNQTLIYERMLRDTCAPASVTAPLTPMQEC